MAKGLELRCLEGLPNINAKDIFEINMDYDYIIIDKVVEGILKNKVSETYKIEIKKVVFFDYVKQADIANASVMGRGAAGWLLLGPAGAILSGMSGVGRKKAKLVLVINYINQQGQESALIFTDHTLRGMANAKTFKPMKAKFDSTPKSEEVMTKLNIAEDGSYLL